MTTTGLTIGGLETAYDQLATAIDAVGEDKSELFLVKLALLAAQQLGDEAVFGGGKVLRESMGQSRATRAEIFPSTRSFRTASRSRAFGSPNPPPPVVRIL